MKGYNGNFNTGQDDEQQPTTADFMQAAQDQIYTSGYNHGLAVGQEQRILNTKLDEEL